ncbi:MAG: phage tail protein [Myxococcota bacterium]
MPVLGKPKDFLKQYKFVIQCDRLHDVKFQKCSQLEREIEVIEINEGGSLYPLKDAGRLKFGTITLTRGLAVNDSDFENWFNEAAVAASDLGGVGDAYKANVDIVNLRRDNSSGKRWRLFNAWPTKLTVGEWDASGNEITIAELELTFDYAVLV